MRSAWLKWARAVEHQRVLARRTREFLADGSYEYVRWDNVADSTDPLVKMQRRLKTKKEFSESWSVLLGDILTNLRAALDHSMWTAVVMHSGRPAKPNQVQFPITTKASSFSEARRKFSALVVPDFWAVIEALQPFHGGNRAHTSPLEVLRWLSNLDKHRAVHIVGRIYFDLAPVVIRSETPIKIVEERRHEGPIDGDNKAVLVLKFERPRGNAPIDVVPTFAFSPSIQISDDPVEYRTLASAMEVMTDGVLKVLTYCTSSLGLPMPDIDSLELGEENDLVAADLAGDVYTFRDFDGTVHRFTGPAAPDEEARPS
ncbi:hypothetical protein [Amycolatopsis mediterranei]|nr:hypothetical protein [Amycolatopsis mediterranei]AEK45977.1 hypothetical protein RAM_37550 [Amycolatopsis mediterranei S699]UZF76299.1 hypothetical protein ISP_007541 [Amycolatopsis mediterranei]